MSGGPKRNADKINTIGIVMIGICGAVLVYVSIAALQAFYANDVADVQTMADYGGQDISAKDLKAAQVGNITNVGKSSKGAAGEQLYQIKIDDGMALVLKSVNGDRAAGVAADPTNLVPSIGTQTSPTIQPIYGRPKDLKQPTTPPPAGAAPADGSGAGSAAAPAAGSGSGSGSAAAAPASGGADPGRPDGAHGLGTTAGTAPRSPTGTTTNTPIKGAGDQKGNKH